MFGVREDLLSEARSSSHGPHRAIDDDAVNTNARLSLIVFIVFFLALALAALWML
jgi:hypothetical protein